MAARDYDGVCGALQAHSTLVVATTADTAAATSATSFSAITFLIFFTASWSSASTA